MTEEISEIWDPFDYTKELTPQFLGFKQPKEISRKQQMQTADSAFWAQKKDLVYLNNHPEIRAIIRALFIEITKTKPLNVQQFFRNFFNCPLQELEKLVNRHVKDVPIVPNLKIICDFPKDLIGLRKRYAMQQSTANTKLNRPSPLMTFDLTSLSPSNSDITLRSVIVNKYDL